MGYETTLIILGVLLALAMLVCGPILAIIALAYASGLKRELLRLRRDLESLGRRLDELEGGRTMPEDAIRPAAAAPEADAAQAAAPPVPPPAVAPQAPAPAVLAPAGAPPAPPSPPARPPAAAPPTPAPVGGLSGLESKIGKRWIAWAGVIVLFFGVAFFLKHAFENAWIGPTGQVVICALGGVAVLACGSRFIHKAWRILGQCLMGLGLAILYATFFAAFSLYEPAVMSQPMAFGFMVAVTAAGAALAVLYDALPVALLAVLGGLLTPVLLSTGQDARDALFTYLMLLDAGVLAVAIFRGWRLLDALALTGTFALYGGWYATFYKAEALGPALAWLGGFYAVFLALPLTYHLVRRVRLTIERFVMALANAAFAFALAWHMLHREYSFALGFVAIGMAAAYLAMGWLIRRRLPEDVPSLFGAVAMTVTFLTLAVPLQLRAHGIMLAWAFEGPVLAFLGYRFRYRPVRVFAAAVLVISAARLFLSDVHWPLHAALYVPFANRQFLTAMMVPAAAALCALVHQRFGKGAAVLDRAMKIASALGAAFLATVIVHAELRGWLRAEHGAVAAGAAATGLWALAAGGYLMSGVKVRPAAAWTWGTGAVALGVAMVLGTALYGRALGRGRLLAVNVRFAACLAASAAAFGYAWMLRRAGGAGGGAPRAETAPVGGGAATRACASVAFGAGLAALLALLSAEVYTFCLDTMADALRARRAGQMSITLVWGLYAACLVFGGFWRRFRVLRLSGLALFGVSALKLVLVDLTHVQDVYRIISFVALGLLMVAASWLYHRLEKRLVGPRAGPAAAGAQPANGERT